MNTVQRLKDILKISGLILFCTLLAFWCAKVAFVVWETVNHGVPGLRDAVVHGTALPRDPKDWGYPNWSRLAAQYSFLALTTILLGLVNRSALGSFWHKFREGLRNRFNDPQ